MGFHARFTFVSRLSCVTTVKKKNAKKVKLKEMISVCYSKKLFFLKENFVNTH